MKKTKLILAISLLGLLGGAYHAAAIGTAFTYQGRLVDAGSPASGNYDLRFTVWDSATAGITASGYRDRPGQGCDRSHSARRAASMRS